MWHNAGDKEVSLLVCNMVVIRVNLFWHRDLFLFVKCSTGTSVLPLSVCQANSSLICTQHFIICERGTKTETERNRIVLTSLCKDSVFLCVNMLAFLWVSIHVYYCMYVCVCVRGELSLDIHLYSLSVLLIHDRGPSHRSFILIHHLPPTLFITDVTSVP